MPLENIQVREVTDAKKPNCFELLAASGDVIKACKTASDGRVIEGQGRLVVACQAVRV